MIDHEFGVADFMCLPLLERSMYLLKTVCNVTKAFWDAEAQAIDKDVFKKSDYIASRD